MYQALIWYQYESVDDCQEYICQQVEEHVRVDGLKQTPAPSEQNCSCKACKLGGIADLVHVADCHFYGSYFVVLEHITRAGTSQL